MKQKEITIQGKQYPAVFDMQTMMNFEEIANKSFFDSKFNTINDRVALIVAAAYAADKDSDITVETVIGNKDWDAVKQIISAFAIISELMGQFFNIPEIEKKDNLEQTEGEGKPKN